MSKRRLSHFLTPLTLFAAAFVLSACSPFGEVAGKLVGEVVLNTLGRSLISSSTDTATAASPCTNPLGGDTVCSLNSVQQASAHKAIVAALDSGNTTSWNTGLGDAVGNMGVVELQQVSSDLNGYVCQGFAITVTGGDISSEHVACRGFDGAWTSNLDLPLLQIQRDTL